MARKAFPYDDAILQYLMSGFIWTEEYSKYLDVKAEILDYIKCEIFSSYPWSAKDAPAFVWAFLLDSWDYFCQKKDFPGEEDLFEEQGIKDYMPRDERGSIRSGVATFLLARDESNTRNPEEELTNWYARFNAEDTNTSLRGESEANDEAISPQAGEDK